MKSVEYPHTCEICQTGLLDFEMVKVVSFSLCEICWKKVNEDTAENIRDRISKREIMEAVDIIIKNSKATEGT